MVAYFCFCFFFFLLFAAASASSSSSTSDSALLWGIWDLGLRKIFVHRHHYHQVGLPTFPSLPLSLTLSHFSSLSLEGLRVPPLSCVLYAPYLFLYLLLYRE